MSDRSPSYNPSEIEPKWQAYWLAHETFKAVDFSPQPKLYVLDMFPYPSGAGLHVGHPEGYTATDIYCRYQRMRGKNVLHPMGWDAFGLPAEQYAVEKGIHPSVTTAHNIENFRRQIRSLGFSYDWSREIDTTDPRYYRWTQWIFLQLYRKGLAYVSEKPVNWCPALGTVLANEEVINGRSERGNHPVERRPMKQWMLQITAYAERLLNDIEALDWPEGIKEQQRNWIGKSVGANVDFKVANQDASIRVFTTRPDTLFGATYMVLAPEHDLVAQLTSPAQALAVEAYVTAAAAKSDMDRVELAKDKTGVYLGSDAINPVNGQRIPIWISDYVLASYGTGAIMAVPAHDTRDFEFASKFGLPVVQVVQPPAGTEWQGFTGDGVAVNSASATLDINGLPTPQAKTKITAWLAAHGLGEEAVNYKLRDWLFSRQRYWGEPFPVVTFDDGEVRLLDESELPVVLPPLDDFKPTGTGESPLAKATAWTRYVCPKTGKVGRRETHTMPQWAGSCWYYLRFIDARNDQAAWDPAKERYWLPVDLYVGGAEHAVLHLLYARFWHKVLFDLGLVSTPEPFQKLINQGLILGMAFRVITDVPALRSDYPVGKLIPNDQVEKRDGKFFHGAHPELELEEFPAKMSKSLKNVVNPDDVIKEYGADSLRLYEMFMGPLTQVKPWNTTNVQGVYRFLHKAWKLVIGKDGQLHPDVQDVPCTRAQLRLLHATIKKVGEDYETLSFNTAISQLMIFVNEFSQAQPRPRAAIATFVQLLAPLAPHLGEELWEALGHSGTITYVPWPVYDPAALQADEIEVLVQVKGKPKARLMLPPDMTPASMEAAARADAAVQAALAGQTVVKVIAVPSKLVNFVTK